MKNTIKNFINQVKKALSNNATIPAAPYAYADANGALIARTFKNNADITIFVAGIVEDVAKRELLYNKDALTLAADTGIFNGGKELPEAAAAAAEIAPAEDAEAETAEDTPARAAIMAAPENLI